MQYFFCHRYIFWWTSYIDKKIFLPTYSIYTDLRDRQKSSLFLLKCESPLNVPIFITRANLFYIYFATHFEILHSFSSSLNGAIYYA